MSGTSADGVDVAIVRLTGRRFRTRFELIAHHAFPYPAAVRTAVLKAMNAQSIAVSELARLNFLLAEIYADCVLRTQRRAGVTLRVGGLPWADDLSSGRGREIPGAQHRLHLADWRWLGGGDAVGNSRGERFSSSRYGGRRPGRAAGSLPRPAGVSPSKAGPDRAEHWRNRQPDGDSRRGWLRSRYVRLIPARATW